MSRDLSKLLAPRSIAFVGASPRPDTPGNDMLRLIRAGGYEGRVHVVSPSHAEIEGFACVPSFADLPAPPDLAVLAVRNERLEEAMAQAVTAGAGAAVIFASGVLAEDATPVLIERLRALAGDRPVCGPNGMGFYNELDHVWIGGFRSPREPVPGAIALVAHSGSVFGALVHNDPRLRVALAVSPGQELTATAADYLAYAVRRPEVRVAGLFLETARDPAGLRAALVEAAERDVPVVALKVGRTPAAAAAALSHTGAVAGSDSAWTALFEETGAMQVETLDELAASLLLCATGRRPAPGGLVAIHDSGGERELTIDLAERAGVPFAAIAPATREAIQARLDPGLVAGNPLDAWGTGKDFVTLFADCFADLLADEAAALGFFCADLRDNYYLHAGFADAAMAAAAGTTKPVAVVTTYTQIRHDGIARRLTEAGVPMLDGTAHALVAARGLLAWRDARQRPPDPLPDPPAETAADRDALCARLARGETPDEAMALALLAAWGVPIAAHRIAGDEAAAVAAGKALGWPVVLKTAMPGIAHKSDAGGVVLELRDAEALGAAWREMAGRLGPRVMVARQAPRRPELALGMVRDPQFGPVVVLGAGGVLIELLDDRVPALPPFGPATARRLLDRLKVRRLLDGYRGGPATDLAALALAVSRFSRLAADLGDRFDAIDVNPLVCGAAPQAVDALFIPAAPETH
jgi:acyl-CoA synthetase (NDP forming)